MEEKRTSQMVVHGRSEANDIEKDHEGADTDETVSISGQMVVHGAQPNFALDAMPAHYEGDDDHKYSASIKQILVEFRRHAHSLMEAQIQLHNRQDINQDQVMSIFEAFADAQVSTQQKTEFRLQSALNDLSQRTLANTHDLVEAATTAVKCDINQNLQFAIHNSWVSALAPIKSFAKDRAHGFADGLAQLLENRIQAAFGSGNCDALKQLKDQLVTLLSEAEKYIEKSVATAIVQQNKTAE